MQRVTLTLPDELIEELEVLCLRLQCSRSALVSLALTEQVSLLSSFCDDISDLDEGKPVFRRAKGESLALIQKRYRELLDEFERY